MGPREFDPAVLGEAECAALRTNQAWAPYPDNDPDAARRHMRRFYALVVRHGEVNIDPGRAAELEVTWWRVHRERQREDRRSEEELVGALVELCAFVYRAQRDAVRPAAVSRVDAMHHSDAWGVCGTQSRRPAADRRASVACGVLHRAARSRQLSTAST